MRSILALLLALLAGPAFAQVTTGTSPLSVAKGGTAGATASAARTNLGLIIGTNVEAWNTNLDCLAALATTGLVRRTGAGACSAGSTVDLSAEVTNTLAVVNGGTGTTTVLAALQSWGLQVPNLAHKAAPVSADKIGFYDVAGASYKYATLSELIASVVSGVSSFNGRNGAVVPASGDYSVALGGTGTTNLQGFISGLQPLKLGGATIAVNPGTWSNNIGTAVFNSIAVLTANLQTAAPNFAVTPATGAQVSGALTATANSTDGTEVFLYLVHRNSDNKPALISSSSDTQGTSQTFTATATTPGVITTGSLHGLRKRMAVYVSNSGGALPAPLGAATQYYVCTVPSTTTFTLATSIANVNSGSCLTFSTTGTGTNTAKWGVQNDLDFQLGAGIATFDRRLPYFAFVWSWTKYGNAGVPGGSNGIPDFQIAQGASDTILTNAGQNGAFQALSSGTAGSFTAVDLSPWLSNLNRRVLVYTVCTYPTTAGGCFMRATGSGGPGIQVGTPSAATIASAGLYSFQTDSATNIDYSVTGGANLSIYVMGWTFVDPS